MDLCLPSLMTATTMSGRSSSRTSVHRNAACSPSHNTTTAQLYSEGEHAHSVHGRDASMSVRLCTPIVSTGGRLTHSQSATSWFNPPRRGNISLKLPYHLRRGVSIKEQQTRALNFTLVRIQTVQLGLTEQRPPRRSGIPFSNVQAQGEYLENFIGGEPRHPSCFRECHTLFLALPGFLRRREWRVTQLQWVSASATLCIACSTNGHPRRNEFTRNTQTCLPWPPIGVFAI